jgi:hypothetical protein
VTKYILVSTYRISFSFGLFFLCFLKDCLNFISVFFLAHKMERFFKKKNLKTPQNCIRRNRDMKQLPFWWPTNIRHRLTTFSTHCSLNLACLCTSNAQWRRERGSGCCFVLMMGENWTRTAKKVLKNWRAYCSFNISIIYFFSGHSYANRTYLCKACSFKITQLRKLHIHIRTDVGEMCLRKLHKLFCALLKWNG